MASVYGHPVGRTFLATAGYGVYSTASTYLSYPCVEGSLEIAKQVLIAGSDVSLPTAAIAAGVWGSVEAARWGYNRYNSHQQNKSAQNVQAEIGQKIADLQALPNLAAQPQLQALLALYQARPPVTPGNLQASQQEFERLGQLRSHIDAILQQNPVGQLLVEFQNINVGGANALLELRALQKQLDVRQNLFLQRESLRQIEQWDQQIPPFQVIVTALQAEIPQLQAQILNLQPQVQQLQQVRRPNQQQQQQLQQLQAQLQAAQQRLPLAQQELQQAQQDIQTRKAQIQTEQQHLIQQFQQELQLQPQPFQQPPTQARLQLLDGAGQFGAVIAALDAAALNAAGIQVQEAAIRQHKLLFLQDIGAAGQPIAPPAQQQQQQQVVAPPQAWYKNPKVQIGLGALGVVAAGITGGLVYYPALTKLCLTGIAAGAAAVGYDCSQGWKQSKALVKNITDKLPKAVTDQLPWPFNTAPAVPPAGPAVAALAVNGQVPPPAANQPPVVPPAIVFGQGVAAAGIKDVDPGALPELDFSKDTLDFAQRKGLGAPIVQGLANVPFLMKKLPDAIKGCLVEGALFTAQGAAGVGRAGQTQPQTPVQKQQALLSIANLFSGQAALTAANLSDLRNHLRTLTDKGLEDVRLLKPENKKAIYKLLTLLELNDILGSGRQITPQQIDQLAVALRRFDPSIHADRTPESFATALTKCIVGASTEIQAKDLQTGDKVYKLQSKAEVLFLNPNGKTKTLPATIKAKVGDTEITYKVVGMIQSSGDNANGTAHVLKSTGHWRPRTTHTWHRCDCTELPVVQVDENITDINSVTRHSADYIPTLLIAVPE